MVFEKENGNEDESIIALAKRKAANCFVKREELFIRYVQTVYESTAQMLRTGRRLLDDEDDDKLP